ncbi:hypothetical protein OOK39_45945 [Streptomyces sp. NBC_00264]|uniref:hypothetical protein n=1 Tax=unclassified Streptomyces TaxID=2593676 RepID=UPI000FBF8231|nr:MULTISPECIES: hypothetical protein [unclassified Streptomyces]WSG48416.1 hypothetical protein OHA38_00315 [Streptomyces sp. NBC_01732]WSW99065.1 hypothetical protein OG355_00425 [Streptomyces sp. NBC_00987]MCX5166362.1 hypothetical protein [Streptomyces sp. NBC_00305]MCX5224879.1 hypothetical protein [Streptomyces sp. NBC_00264]RPK54214.1 hypothetical protein EES42_43475 [Streptomyces sp. ADI95-17]
MGTRDQDQDDVVEPARPPLTAEQAREVTAGLREAMDDVRHSVALLAARVRDAHTARVWTPLGYGSWESYCDAEFAISRAQAYRLLDVARALAAIHDAVAAAPDLSRTRNSAPAAAAALDYGLSQRALIAVSSRTDTVAAVITRRLATLAHSGLTSPQPTHSASSTPATPGPSLLVDIHDSVDHQLTPERVDNRCSWRWTKPGLRARGVSPRYRRCG